MPRSARSCWSGCSTRIAGRFGLSQLEPTDALYPDAHEGDAARSLQQLEFQTRKCLGASLPIRCGDGYALGAVTSDAEAFLETDDTRLWRGSYLANAGTGDEVVAGALHHALRMRMEASLEAEPAEALPVSDELPRHSGRRRAFLADRRQENGTCTQPRRATDPYARFATLSRYVFSMTALASSPRS